MAGTSAKSTYFAFGSVGTETDMSAMIDNVEMPVEVETEDDTVFGKSAHTYIITLENNTASVSGPWSQTVDNLLGAAKGATGKGIVYGPGGNTTGLPKYSGAAILTKYSPSAAVGGKVEFSAEFQLSDTLTRATF